MKPHLNLVSKHFAERALKILSDGFLLIEKINNITYSITKFYQEQAR